MPLSVQRRCPPSLLQSFIARWSAASASERAHSQIFLAELCGVLTVPRPDPAPDSGCAFLEAALAEARAA